MPGLSDQELSNYLEELTQATRSDLIAWYRANPTTFVWNKREVPRAELALQQIMRKQLKVVNNTRVVSNATYYILRVYGIDGDDRTLREEIDGSNSEILNEKMGLLFDFISHEKAQKDLEFLRGTLPQRKP
jgi:hypothetical protein